MRMDEDVSFTKKNYEVAIQASDRVFVKDTNTRWQEFKIHLVSVMSRKISLPKMIILVLEDDVIKHLNHNDYGATELFGKIIDHMHNEITRTITTFKKFLPARAKKLAWPQIIWMAPTTHHNYLNNTLRKKFSSEMSVQLRGRQGTMILQPKQVWDSDDNRLVEDNHCLSKLGRNYIWQAIDKSIAFADRTLFQSYQTTQNRPIQQHRIRFQQGRRRLPPPPTSRKRCMHH